MNTIKSTVRFLHRSRDHSISNILNNIKVILRSRRDVNYVLQTVDISQYEILAKEYGEQGEFVPLRYGLEFNLRHVYRLGLHRSQPLNILDIGPGCGYFPYLCCHFGHHVMTIDLGTSPTYNALCDFFHVNRTNWKVEAYQALPDLGVKFDLITAHHICFDNHTEPDAWGEKEYTFFLEDLRDRQLLRDESRVFLLLNRNKLFPFFARLDDAFVDGDRLYFFSSKKRLNSLR